MLAKRSMDANATCLSITLGLVISAYVSPANLQDRDGLKHLLDQYFEQGTTRLRKLWVDGGYRGDDLKGMGR